MTTIIDTGNSGNSSGNSEGGWSKTIQELLPVLAIGAAIYFLLPSLASLFGKSSDSGGSGSTTYVTGSSGWSGQSPGTYYAGSSTGSSLPSGGTLYQPTSNVASQYITAPVTATQPIFVTAGSSTPTNFWPGGNGVISTSRDLTGAEQSKVWTNLQNSGITNAWWSPVQTITQTTQPGGVNSGGSFQSNIPVNTRHCSGPGAGAPSTDTWHYC